MHAKNIELREAKNTKLKYGKVEATKLSRKIDHLERVRPQKPSRTMVYITMNTNGSMAKYGRGKRRRLYDV